MTKIEFIKKLHDLESALAFLAMPDNRAIFINEAHKAGLDVTETIWTIFQNHPMNFFNSLDGGAKNIILDIAQNCKDLHHVNIEFD